ncbi:hypothetical protein V5O48_003123 [Marasmius crinis-equi]|uniref:Uncharacterized protein n=1 Tax=Marasmius crinis-equi TaxID=585013 RepID=A0ABR3FTQ8_9AGAR
MVKPTDDLHCDATNPLWARFLGYAGSPLAFCLLFFALSLIWYRWRGSHTTGAGGSQTVLTSLPSRMKGNGPYKRGSLRSVPPLVLPTPSPLPSPHPVPARVPISPGFVSPTLSARQFHLPFSPLTPLDPDVNETTYFSQPIRNEYHTTHSIYSHSEHQPNPIHSTRCQNDLSTTYSSTLGDHNARKQPDYDCDYEESVAGSVVSASIPRFVSASSGSHESPIPPTQHTLNSKESNDFLKYLNEYKEKERRSGDSYIEKVSRDAQWTHKSSLSDWDDLSSLRWNRDEYMGPVDSSLGVEHWAASWTRGAIGKFVGGRNNGGNELTRVGSGGSRMRVTEDSESYYFTAEDATPRGFEASVNDELFRREAGSRTTRTTRSRASPRELNQQQQQHSDQSSPLVWSIIKVQLPITLVLILATLSTLIDVINQANNPSSFPQPTPFGTHHVAFILIVWGPVFAFGCIPAIRQRLFFRRS